MFNILMSVVRINEFLHNPYIGYYHRKIKFISPSALLLPNLSPHVGTFRHAPTTNSLIPLKDGKNMLPLSKLQRKVYYYCVVYCSNSMYAE